MGSKTYRSHNVSRMIEDEHIKPMSQSVILSYVRSNDSASTKTSARSLSDYLNEGAQSTIIAKLKKGHRMSKASTYAVGEVKGSYTFQPTKERLETQLVSTLNNILGFTPDIVYQEFGKANYYHIAKYTLQESYRYNPITNEVVSESERIGKRVYLKDIEIQLNQETVNNSDQVQLVLQGPSATSGYTPFRLPLNRPHTQLLITSAVADSLCTFKLCYADDQGKEVTYTTTMHYLNYISTNAAPAGSIDEDTALNSNPNVVAPTMVAPTTDADYVMAYYTYTRNGVQYAEYFTYRSGSNLIVTLESVTQTVEKVGIYPPRLYARMYGQKYTDYAKGTDEYKCMVKYARILGISWADWVDEVHNSMNGLEYVREIFVTYGAQANSDNAIIHQYLYHYFETAYRGLPNIAATGTYGRNSIFIKAKRIPATAKQGTTIQLKDKLHTTGISFSAVDKARFKGTIADVGDYSFKYTNGIHTYYYQETANSYTAISVYNLQSADLMDNNYGFAASGDSDDLIVPIDLAITAGLNTVKLERLYAMSMQIVVNTSRTVKKKWYQSGVFKFVMTVVGIVIAVFFPPAGIAALSAMAVVVGIAMTIATTIIITLLQKLVIALGLSSTAFQVVMIVLAVVAAMYGSYLNLTKSIGAAGMTATRVMFVSNAAFAMATAGNQAALNKALSQYQSAVADLKSRDEALKDSVESLGLLEVPTPDLLIYLPPVSLTISLGEQAEDYYAKSIHNVNVGTYVYDYIESYVDINVMLPNINQLSINLEKLRNG